MTVGSLMPELDWGTFLPPPPSYKIGSQNTPYKLGLRKNVKSCKAITEGELFMGVGSNLKAVRPQQTKIQLKSRFNLS